MSVYRTIGPLVEIVAGFGGICILYIVPLVLVLAAACGTHGSARKISGLYFLLVLSIKIICLKFPVYFSGVFSTFRFFLAYDR